MSWPIQDQELSWVLTPDSWLIYINIYVYTCVYVYVWKSWENKSTYWTNLDCWYNYYFTLVHILVCRVENHFRDNNKHKLTSWVFMLRNVTYLFAFVWYWKNEGSTLGKHAKVNAKAAYSPGGLFEKLTQAKYSMQYENSKTVGGGVNVTLMVKNR